LVTRLQDNTPSDWGYATYHCPPTSYEVADAPAQRTAPASLTSVFGNTHELTYCGGDALLTELGWPRLVAGVSRARLRYEAGQYVVYSGCTKTNEWVTVEGGRLRVELGAVAFAASSDLQLRSADPALVHASAGSVPGHCNVHAVAAATPDQMELCLSAYSGAPGAVLYASFRSRCD
jgi:hypothetical protein